jgi:hypothetical protein
MGLSVEVCSVRIARSLREQRHLSATPLHFLWWRRCTRRKERKTASSSSTDQSGPHRSRPGALRVITRPSTPGGEQGDTHRWAVIGCICAARLGSVIYISAGIWNAKIKFASEFRNLGHPTSARSRYCYGRSNASRLLIRQIWRVKGAKVDAERDCASGESDEKWDAHSHFSNWDNWDGRSRDRLTSSFVAPERREYRPCEEIVSFSSRSENEIVILTFVRTRLNIWAGDSYTRLNNMLHHEWWELRWVLRTVSFSFYEPNQTLRVR